MTIVYPKEKIGRYEISALIGVGAYSEVYLAHDTKLDRKISLKLIKPEILSLLQDGGNILKESSILAKLNHPNIVTIFDVFKTKSTIAFAMEYLEGATLKDEINKFHSVSEILKLFRQLASAIQTIHSKEIVHGDIKPSNMVFDSTSSIKIIDFGLAKIADHATRYATQIQSKSTYSTSLMGTLPYMAPEIINGESGGPRSDIFSLGAVFYEVVCGKQAFSAANEAGVIHQIMGTYHPAVEPVNKEVPEKLLYLIEEMLAKDQEERVSCIDDVVSRLNDIDSTEVAKFDFSKRIRNWPTLFPSPKLAKPAATILVIIGFFFLWNFASDNYGPISLTQQLDQGFEYLQHYETKGNLEKAKNTFENILQQDNQNAAATSGLSLTFMRMYTSDNDDPELLSRAKNTAELALSLDPHLALSQLAMAKINQHQGKIGEAETYYNNALELSPADQDTVIGLSDLYIKTDRTEQAIELLNSALETDPDNARYMDEIAVSYYRLGQYENAKEYFQKSIHIRPDNPYSYGNLSGIQHLLGETTDAIMTLQDGLKIRPTKQLYSNLGTYYFFLKQYPQSVTAYENAINLEGGVNDYQIWTNLADAYQMIPSLESDAKEAYTRAYQILVKQRPDWQNDNQTRTRAALLKAKSDELEEASGIIMPLIERSDLAPDVLFRITQIQAIREDQNKALQFLDKAISAGYPISEIENTPELFELRQTKEYQLLMTKHEGETNDSS